jgi:hypothetical protein
MSVIDVIHVVDFLVIVLGSVAVLVIHEVTQMKRADSSKWKPAAEKVEEYLSRPGQLDRETS